ncbi:MAG TPA: c-type cytochrome [Blastocatellia bacterium]|nr:c-type cytochrome [Blastocatellia bacterium]
MSRLKRFIGILGITVFLAWFLIPSISKGEGDDPGGLSGNPMKGRNIFISKGCIKCHSIWGMGGKLGPDLTRIGMGRSFLQIAGSLWSHSPKMIELMKQRGVARPTFTPEEMGDFISYLYYLNYFNEPGDAIAGRNLFSQRSCINCHAVGNMGGRIGPPLDDYQKYASPLFVAQAMWNHGPQMGAKMRALGIKHPAFHGKEMADLLAFIRGQASGTILNEKFMLPGSPVSGRRLFAQKGCINCHSINGKGGKVGPDLARKDFYKSVTEIAGAMWNHDPQMWGKMQQSGRGRPAFNGNEMADVIAYLYFIRYVDRPGDAANGKRIFEQKGCAECHSLGQGTKIGPDLSGSASLDSPMSLTTAMWNHAPAMEQLVQEKGLPWPKFEGDEMRDLVEYLKTFARPSARK